MSSGRGSGSRSNSAQSCDKAAAAVRDAEGDVRSPYSPPGRLPPSAAAVAGGARTTDGSGEEMEPFTPYATRPAGQYRKEVGLRVMVLLLTVAALALVCVTNGVKMLRIALYEGAGGPGKKPKPKDVYFDIFMWKVDAHDGPRPMKGEWSSITVNRGMRALVILSMVFLGLGMVLAMTFAAVRCAAETARRQDDEARRAAGERRQRRRNVEELGDEDAFDDGRGAGPQRGASSPPSATRGDCEADEALTEDYAARERKRRQVDFNVGVATFVFLVLGAGVCLAAVILFPVYSHHGLVDALDDADAKYDDDDIEDDGTYHYKAGYWLFVPALVLALVSIVLHVIPAVTGLRLCGPRPVPEDSAARAGPAASQRQELRSLPYGGYYNDANSSAAYASDPAVGAAGGSGATAETKKNGKQSGASPYAANFEPGSHRTAAVPTSSAQQRQQALRGIPVALPGPPVDSLDVATGEVHVPQHSYGDAQGGQRHDGYYPNHTGETRNLRVAHSAAPGREDA